MEEEICCKPKNDSIERSFIQKRSKIQDSLRKTDGKIHSCFIQQFGSHNNMKNTKTVDSYKDLHANVKNEYDNRDRSPLTQIPSTITSFMEKARPKNKFDFCNVQEKENYDMMNCNSVSTNSKSNLKKK